MKVKQAQSSYKDMAKLDFQILLTHNYYVNPSNIHLCFPKKMKNSTDESADIDSDLITVNNFNAHLMKQISITK